MVDLALLLSPLALPFTVPALPLVQLHRDSRRIQPGDLFVAVAGHQADGRDFIDAALAAGAAAVLIDGDSDQLNWSQGKPLLTINGLAGYLPQLAARFYGQPGYQLQITGITGTNGKTSTSHLCAQLSNALGQSAAVIGTLGNGPLTTLRDTLNTTPDAIELQQLLSEFADGGIERVVMEVSSHGLVQGRVEGVPINIAVFTNLSRDHLDYHGTMEAYRDAKRLLFSHPQVRTAVVNVDDSEGRLLLSHIDPALTVIAFGESAVVGMGERFVSARNVALLADGIHGTLVSDDDSAEFFAPLLGRFNLSNLLASVAVALAWGYPLSAIAAELSNLKPVNGRMELFHQQQAPAVVVDYAHTPDALVQVLAAARGHCKGKLWCVFGCGGDRDRGKRPLMAAAAAEGADRLIVTADNPRSEAFDRIVDDMRPGWGEAEVQVIADRATAIATAFAAAQPDDLVLIAGKGHENYQIIGATRHSYSDREVVRALLEVQP